MYKMGIVHNPETLYLVVDETCVEARPSDTTERQRKLCGFFQGYRRKMLEREARLFDLSVDSLSLSRRISRILLPKRVPKRTPHHTKRYAS